MKSRSTLLATALIAFGPSLATGCYRGVDSFEDTDGGSTSDSAPTSTAADTEWGTDGEDGPSAAPDLLGPGVCVDTFERFRDEVWTSFMATDCHGCHNPSGLAASTTFVLHDAAHPNYLTENLQTLRTAATAKIDGVALPLLKMSAEIPHGGQIRFEPESSEYQALQNLIEELEAPEVCKGPADYDTLVAKLDLLDPERTLRRATFSLVGHPPSDEQVQRVRQGDWDTFDEVLDEVMAEPAFPERIGEIYNEALLTDTFLLQGTTLLFRIDQTRYPTWDWYEDEPDSTAARVNVTTGMTKAPLELIEHVVREGLPFSEILLADYTMVNSFSARTYGLDTSQFENINDPTEYRPAVLPGIPHAGILTSAAFLNRYPNTDTNLNRHRSRHTYRLFQGTDVLRLSLRALDLEAIDDENPTMTNNACAVCHSTIDPIASAFQNWSNNGRYRLASELEDPWTDDVRGPGFNGEEVPAQKMQGPLQWLAPKLVDNPRFSVAVVKAIFAGVLRQTPLNEPTNPMSETYYEDIIGFALEDTIIKGIAEAFRSSNYDIRVLLKELIRSPLYRAVGADPVMTDEQRTMLRNVGVAHPLRPTQLYARIEQKTGYPWMPDVGSTIVRDLELLFGEIDSRTTTTRLPEANGLFASYVARMSDRVACRVVGSEYATPAEQRRLFPLVSFQDTPDTSSGRDSIRDNIRHLHDYLFDTRPAVDDEEIEATYALFETVRTQGLAEIDAGASTAAIGIRCRTADYVDGTAIAAEQRLFDDPEFIARSWMAVLAYLLTDYRFLHE